jgi:hypothetical protein
MSYVLLILESGEARRSRPAAQGRLAYERMTRFAADLKARGVLTACDALKSDAEGVRIEVRGGQRSRIDGPFTESKEIVGGFAILRANSKAEAIELAREFLHVAGDGECEIRQIFEQSGSVSDCYTQLNEQFAQK